MKENLKIGLLAIIALGTVANFLMLASTGSTSANEETTSAAVATNVNNWQANNPAQGLNTNATNPNPQAITADMNTPPQQLNEPPKPQTPPTKMAFAQMEHDFGNIFQESENKYQFTFTNTGDKPLTISNAVGSCGCTVPNWPKEPIMPGKKGTIDVVYKPGQQEGKQEKTVTVTANTDPMTTMLKIKANVMKKG